MISDDERCEVAENLRYLTIGRSIHYKEQFFDELAETVVSFEDYHDFCTVIEKLADLIDPTCEAVECGRPDESRVCKSCSKCSYGWFEDIHDKPYSYCPNCGARVVSTDD